MVLNGRDASKLSFPHASERVQHFDQSIFLNVREVGNVEPRKPS
jgi:hypothetical protein